MFLYTALLFSFLCWEIKNMTASAAGRFAQLRHSRSDKEKYSIKEDEEERDEGTAGLGS
jgi:hypothetical protein